MKQACALVIAHTDEGISTGSAFCIHPGGVFITNDHVVSGNEEVDIIVAAGEENERRLQAAVVRTDDEEDIAILVTKETPDEAFPYLPMGEVDDLYETQQVTAYGYPLGNALSMRVGDTPQISINIGHITSLRRQDGAMELIQLDAMVNPGNSGGPVVTDNGQVIGVVVAGLPGSGINFAIPITEFKEELLKPLNYAKLTLGSPSEARRMTMLGAAYFDFINPGAERQIVLDAEMNSYLKKAVLTETVLGRFQGEIQLIPDDYLNELTLKVFEGNDASIIQVQDMKLDDDEIGTLSNIEYIDRKGSSRIKLQDGPVLKNHSLSLGKVQAQIGKVNAVLNLDNFDRIEVLYEAPIEIDYQFSLKEDDVYKALSKGTLILTENNAGLYEGSAKSSGNEGVPTGLLGPEVSHTEGSGLNTLKLPAPADDMMIAGNGKYWVFWLSSLKKIALVDITQQQIVRYFNMSSANTLVTAGSSQLVVYNRDSETFISYDLESGEILKNKRKTFPDSVKDIIMGSASEGPLIVCSTEGTDYHNRGGFSLVDLDDFHQTKIDWDRKPYISYGDKLHLRTSPDGKLLTWFEFGSSPCGVDAVFLNGNKAEYNDLHATRGYVHPADYEHFIVTGAGSVYTSSLRDKTALKPRGLPMLPAYKGPYFIEFDFNEHPANNMFMMNIGTFDDQSILTSIPVPRGPYIGNVRYPSDYDKYYFFSINDNLIAWIDDDKTEITFMSFDLFAALKAEGVSFLAITSTPPTHAERGETLRYQITARTDKEPLSYRLDAAPEGMTVSPSGLLDWTVPEHVPLRTSVIVTVTNADGEAVYHPFEIEVASGAYRSAPLRATGIVKTSNNPKQATREDFEHKVLMMVANHIRKSAHTRYSSELNDYIISFDDGKTLSLGESVRVNSKQYGPIEIEVIEITTTTARLAAPSGEEMNLLFN